MQKMSEKCGVHVLAVPYPIQGHINPMLQFCRRLVSKGVTASLAITNHISTTLNPKSDGHVRLVSISDGYDDGGFWAAPSTPAYLAHFEAAASRDLGDLVEEHRATNNPITCIVYDAFMPWCLNVAKKYGILGAHFFTQPCGVNLIYHLAYRGKFTIPESLTTPVDISGLPPMYAGDLPSFMGSPESYPAYVEVVLNQYMNIHEADFVLVNTVYELEDKLVDAMSKERPILTVGPTIPSYYLDNRIAFDKDYGLNLYHLDPTTVEWLSTKPPRSVVYVSFGSMACLSKAQFEELAMGLKQSNRHFLWVVRASEEGKLPEGGFSNEVAAKGFIVRWCPQLEVLNSEAIGCFLTHCGWNSTLEALAMGVPLIGMPQWTDQPTVAKFVEDVWKIGVRVKVNDEDGMVRREEIASCINDVMAGERSGELIKNARKWKVLVKDAISQGGSSDNNIDEFISKI